jgi:hypothetical protein
VPDVKGARRICGNEFHDDAATSAHFAAAIARAQLNQSREFLVICSPVQVEIDETGPRNFDSFDAVAGGQHFEYGPGEFARILLRGAGELHRRVARKVAVAGVPGALDMDGQVVRRSGAQIFRQGRNSVLHQFFYQVFQGVAVTKTSARAKV